MKQINIKTIPPTINKKKQNQAKQEGGITQWHK